MVSLTLLTNFTILYTQSLIERFNNQHNFKTNVYYVPKVHHLEVLPISVNYSAVTKIILTSSHNFVLKQHFSTNVLIVILITADFNENVETVKVLHKTLNSCQNVQMLLISAIESNGTNLETWHPLFKIYWEHGFGKIILANMAAEPKLLTFEPFPQLQVKRTTLGNYLKGSKSPPNFQLYPIRTLVGNDEPYSFVYRTTHNGDDILQYEGLVVQFIRLFARHYNGTFMPVHFPGLGRYSTQDCVDFINNNLTDICASNFIIMRKYATSRTLKITYTYLMAPYGEPIKKLNYFFKPFDTEIWCCLLATICYTTALLALTHFCNYRVWNFGKYFLITVQSLIYNGCILKHLQLKSKILIWLLLMGTGFVLSNLYVTLLSSMLTTKLYQRPINNIADLKANNITILLSNFDKRSLNVFGATPEFNERSEYVDFEYFKKLRDNLNTQHAFIGTIDRIQLYLYQQKFLKRPRLKQLTESPGGVWSAQVIRENWAFEHLYNRHLLRIFETGFYEKIYDDIREFAIKTGFIRFFHTDDVYIEPLNLSHFAMPAILLAVGYSLSTFCFAIEWCIFYTSKWIKKKISLYFN